MKNGTKTVIFGALISIIILMSACVASSEADETMQTQLQDATLKDEMLQADNNIEENVIDVADMEGAEPEIAAYNDEKENKADIELDDELREELTAQLLKDKNLDTSILRFTKKTKCIFDLPKGFEESEDMPGMYLNEHYPVDASTIYYAELDKNTALQLMTEETFKKNMESELNQIYDSEIKLKVESFEKTKINGFASFKILYSYTNNDIKITQLQYIINADKTYVITYSQTDEYDRMAEFETSAETIQVTS